MLCLLQTPSQTFSQQTNLRTQAVQSLRFFKTTKTFATCPAGTRPRPSTVDPAKATPAPRLAVRGLGEPYLEPHEL
ncbi:hypothetical protein NPX13_g8569 [Xylaria arbuscula]|uniref:Uncharacterized protein n=1 Tax=Xylaria arbuscula TaxID=114810 RepID=A0A9W8TJB1_9PEZI|nr:hypothetical protein NPX13_g8569 [Xylaria arbuscula]